VAAASATAVPDPAKAQAASAPQTVDNHGGRPEGADRGSIRSVAAHSNIRVVSVQWDLIA